MSGAGDDEKRRSAEGEKLNERAEASERSGNDRRSAHRVTDDQGSGEGSLSALSKFKMIERRKRLFGRHYDAQVGEPPW